MAELQELEIVIKPDGEVVLDVKGVKGERCLDITRPFEQLLGGEIVERRHTDEYYQQSDRQSDYGRLKKS